ncbi:L,D-transpeptidase family protein [Croceibacterium sp. LX-88]|uniref:L,D-transpeptidase family protein n=1 Tax=Croceibacterium selenioxidans TaxID=2838833 RepID=A0ABS5W750_9SPHN|nr:L,D-transpeptidase family protein [Croceibacterium selenioxidans]MBT2135494.1 L,D-transpeptidase family protein [Croceibacterium selenioxidans]
MNRTALLATCLAACFVGSAASAQAVDRGDRSILEMVSSLTPGEYVWAPELSPQGPALLVVNLETQHAVLFRNGVPIAASTVSTGSEGHETPTGVFTILQKRKEHYSNRYNNAPMPNMQRLTWDGIALHAGKLPGYPASHGCIRLPMAFSALLFDTTQLGMTVVITSIPAVPQGSAAPNVTTPAASGSEQALADAPFEWHPERAPEGLVSVIVSVADQRAIVLRGGVEIGSAPIRSLRAIDSGTAYILRSWDDTGRKWLKVKFAGPGGSMEATVDDGGQFDAPSGFRRAISDVLALGSVIIVTPESLTAGAPGSQLMVIEDDAGSQGENTGGGE